MRLKQGHVLAAGCVVLFCIAVLLVLLEHYSNNGDTTKKMTIGVVLQGGFDEPGWNHRNYKGMQEAAGTLGLLLDAHENVRGNSEDAAQTITQLEAAKRKLVVLSSADYAADMQRICSGRGNGIHPWFLPSLRLSSSRMGIASRILSACIRANIWPGYWPACIPRRAASAMLLPCRCRRRSAASMHLRWGPAA